MQAVFKIQAQRRELASGLTNHEFATTAAPNLCTSQSNSSKTTQTPIDRVEITNARLPQHHHEHELWGMKAIPHERKRNDRTA